jgi:hypothetical protein
MGTPPAVIHTRGGSVSLEVPVLAIAATNASVAVLASVVVITPGIARSFARLFHTRPYP